MSESRHRPALQAICATLGLALGEQQASRLSAFLNLLQHWNAAYNLTAIREAEAMLTQHLADCLAVIKPLERQLIATPTRLLDVGSGGGLPGVVLATLLPQIRVVCIDAVGKKAAFVRQVAAELRLPNLQAEHGRVEQLRQPPFDVIVSRAFASLADFVRLTETLLATDGFWMAMKGKRPDQEVMALDAAVSVFHVEQLEVPGLEADRCLVWMRKSSTEKRQNL